MRKLATLATIEAIHPHTNADNLELAKVRGWQICVKKGEFNPGDPCVYVEIDSVLPERPEFEFMRDRRFRVRTIKLRGEISQGIVFPTDIIPTDAGSFDVADDLTEVLDINLYAPPKPPCVWRWRSRKVKVCAPTAAQLAPVLTIWLDNCRKPPTFTPGVDYSRAPAR